MNIQKVDKNCGVSKTLKIIGSKWTIMILHRLCSGTMRFGQLQRSLKGISPKTLSVRLQQLEKDGIVKKHIFAEVPLHVEYSLTPKGQSLKKIIELMQDWGETRYHLAPGSATNSITSGSASRSSQSA